MTLREKLLAGERVRVKIPNGREITVGIYVAAFGVKFLSVYSDKGRRLRNASAMWNTWSCDQWIESMKEIL